MASDAITERGGGTPSQLRGEVPRSLAEPRERLEMLCDPGSFRTLRSGVLSRNIEGQPGDGVLVGVGRVSGRPLVCYAEDPSFMGGSLGETHADSIVRALELANSAGTPIVGFVESGGARLQEGHAALAGYGRIFRASVKLSRRVPQISIVAGVSAGGGSYAPALTDFVVMTDEARMFLTGPRVVRWALGENVSMEELGGPRIQERNGVCQLVADDDEQAVQRVRQLVGFLPQTIGDRPRAPNRSQHRLSTPRRWCPQRPAASMTSAMSRGRSPTPKACSSWGRPGQRTWSPPWPASRASRSG